MMSRSAMCMPLTLSDIDVTHGCLCSRGGKGSRSDSVCGLYCAGDMLWLLGVMQMSVLPSPHDGHWYRWS